MYVAQMSRDDRARIMARVDAMHAREGITGEDARAAREAAQNSRVTDVLDALRDSEGAPFDVVDTGGGFMAFVATLSNGALYVVSEDDEEYRTWAGWYVADAAGWHDGEEVEHEGMALADAIVKAAGL